MRWEERHISWWDKNRECEVLRFFPSRPQSGWHWRIWEYPHNKMTAPAPDEPAYYSQNEDGMENFVTVIEAKQDCERFCRETFGDQAT